MTPRDVTGSGGKSFGQVSVASRRPQKNSLHHHQPMHGEQGGEQGGEDETGEEADHKAALEAGLQAEGGAGFLPPGVAARGPGDRVVGDEAFVVEIGEVARDLQQQLQLVRGGRSEVGAEAVKHVLGGEAVDGGLIEVCHGALPPNSMRQTTPARIG